MRNYAYNYRFLAEYAAQHQITQKELAIVMQTNADGITRWTDGIYPKDSNNKPDKTQPRRVIPVPTDKLLLFCNHYGVDLSEFFTESDHPTSLSPKIVNGAVSSRGMSDIGRGVPDIGRSVPDVNQATKVLQLELQHAKEINALLTDYQTKEQQLLKECREHEDKIRQECDDRIEEYRRMIDTLQASHAESNRLIQHALGIRDTEGNRKKRNGPLGGDVVSEPVGYEEDYGNFPEPPDYLR